MLNLSGRAGWVLIFAHVQSAGCGRQMDAEKPQASASAVMQGAWNIRTGAREMLIEGASTVVFEAEYRFHLRCKGQSPLSVSSKESALARWQRTWTRDQSLPGVQLTAAQLVACARGYERLACDGPDVPSECDLRGLFPNGSRCVIDAQCQSGLCTAGQDGSANGECGECIERTPEGSHCEADTCARGCSCIVGTCRRDLEEGASCDDEQSDWCGPGLVCGASGQCTSQGRTGDACTNWAQCGFGNECQDGVCRRALQEGDACTARSACDMGLRCEAGRCEKIHYASAGERCDGHAVQCERGICARGTRRCPSIVHDDDVCDAQGAESMCDFFARCVDGRCRLPMGDGCAAYGSLASIR